MKMPDNACFYFKTGVNYYMRHEKSLRYFKIKEKKPRLRGRIVLISLLAGVVSCLLFFTLPSLFQPAVPSSPQGRISPEMFRKTLSAVVSLVWPKTSPRLVKIEKQVRRGDTIINTLTREGLPYQAAYKFFSDVKPVYDLRKINTGKPYTLFLNSTRSDIEKFRYQIDLNQYLEVVKDGRSGSFRGKLVTLPFEKRKYLVSGKIKYSLFESIMESGEKPELADILASLYEYDIDFNRDIQPGDTFSVVVEKKYLKGEFVSYGAVLASEFSNNGKVIRVIRYTDPDGKTAYYHPDGRSVRKMFLRCPLPFMRVTSRYGMRRHPVLGFSARHRGVDFGAPRGTRVRASASGVIKRMGYDRGKGRFVMVRHPNGYISHYYHFSRFAKGMRRGRRVEQGQIIGYVGSTGLSSGPHLHYGLQKHGGYLNPLSLKSPTKSPVKPVHMKHFRGYAARFFLVIAGSRFVDIPPMFQQLLLGPTETKQLRTDAPINI